jgi:hypothetical protein
MTIKGVKKVIFRGVSSIAPDYEAIARAVCGDNVVVENNPSLDPRLPEPAYGDPKLTVSTPEEKDSGTLLFFSTSTLSVPAALILFSFNVKFGVVEHSPSDGSTLAAWVSQQGKFERCWTPAQDQELAARQPELAIA